MVADERSENDGGGKQEMVKDGPRCTCGIEIAWANEMCPERDCPYARGRS